MMMFVVWMALIVAVGMTLMTWQNKKKAKVNELLDNSDMSSELAQSQLLDTDFYELKELMKDKPIDAITSAKVVQSMSEAIKSEAGYIAKSVLLKGIGIRLVKEDAPIYAVLSGKDFHLFVFGDDTQHLIFDEFRMEKARLSPAPDSKMDNLTKQGEYEVLTFDIDGNEFALKIYDRILPQSGEMPSAQQQFMYIKAGSAFLPKIKTVHPNLLG